MRRIARYKEYRTHPGALEMDIVQKYKDQVLQAELTAMSAASQSAPPGAKESRASRSGASQPAARRVKRSRDADDDPRPGDAADLEGFPGELGRRAAGFFLDLDAVDAGRRVAATRALEAGR